MKHTRLRPADPAINAALAADELNWVADRLANWPTQRIADAVKAARIAQVEPVSVAVRMPNERLFALHRKCAAGTATTAELDELEAICAELEGKAV